MMKKVLALILLLFAFSALSLTAFAASDTVYDENGMIDSADKQAINEALSSAKSRTGVDFFVYFSDATVSGRAGEYDLKRCFDVHGDAVILLVEKVRDEYYECELFTYGSAYSDLSDSDCDDILDDPIVYTAIKAGRFADGAVAFASLTADRLLSSRSSDRTAVIVISVIIALAAGGTVFGVNLYRYKKKLKSPIYPLHNYANLQLDYATDHFLGSAVTRTRVSSSRSGGGGSHGGSRGRR